QLLGKGPYIPRPVEESGAWRFSQDGALPRRRSCDEGVAGQHIGEELVGCCQSIVFGASRFQSQADVELAGGPDHFVRRAVRMMHYLLGVETHRTGKTKQRLPISWMPASP